MSRGKVEIKAVLHMPEGRDSVGRFEKRVGDFYADLVEKELNALSKENKLKVIDALLLTFDDRPELP